MWCIMTQMTILSPRVELGIIDLMGESIRYGESKTNMVSIQPWSHHTVASHCSAYNSLDHERILRKMLNEMFSFYFRTYRTSLCIYS